MAFLTVDADIRATPALAEYIGIESIRAFSKRHPLSSGFRSFFDLQNHSTASGIRSLLQLEQIARAIEKHLIGKVPKYRLLGNLRNERACRALVFEAQVLTFAIEPYVARAAWRRYDEGVTDIITMDPSLQVECTLVATHDLETMLRRVTTKRKLGQRSEKGGAFVLVVGTSVEAEPHILHSLTAQVRDNRDDWMGHHAEVSAILVVAPKHRDETELVQDVGDDDTLALRFEHYYTLWMRNLKAHDPLPVGFELDKRDTLT